MTEPTAYHEARERLIHAICSRLPDDMAAILGEALRSRRGLNFGTSDPEVARLVSELNALDAQHPRPPASES